MLPTTPVQPARGRRGALPWIALAAAITFLGVMLVKPWANVGPTSAPPQPPATSPTPSAGSAGSPGTTSGSSPTSAAAEAASPTGDATGCQGDRVTLTTAEAGDMALAVRLPPIPAARTGRVAFIQGPPNDRSSRRLVVVADAHGAKAIAAVVVPTGGGGPWARVRDWSRDGALLLVEAGRFSPTNALHNCGDLYLVAADGTGVTPLTHNDPGASAVSASFTGHGTSIAYLEADELHDPPAATLRQTDACALNLGETLPCGVAAPFLPYDGSLVVSPDGVLIAVACPAGVMTYNPGRNEGGTILPQPSDQGIGAIAWTHDSRHVAALVFGAGGDSSPSSWQQADWRGDTTTSVKLPANNWEVGPGVGQISPDQTRLLLTACAGNAPCTNELWMLTPGTGASRRLRSSPIFDYLDASWLPGGTAIDVRDGDGWISIPVDRPTATAAIDVPSDAAWWTPPTT